MHKPCLDMMLKCFQHFVKVIFIRINIIMKSCHFSIQPLEKIQVSLFKLSSDLNQFVIRLSLFEFTCEYRAVGWWGCALGWESACANPVMTFPIKKRSNTELFIYKTAAVYKQASGVRDEINRGNQPGVEGFSIPWAEKVWEWEIRRQPVSKWVTEMWRRLNTSIKVKQRKELYR